MMIVDRVREAVGPDYMIDMRISGTEHVEGGMPVEEVAEFIHRIEDKIDMIHVSCGIEVDNKTKIHMSSTTYAPHMVNIDLAKIIRDKVSIPVAVVGAIMTPEEAEWILENEYADAIVVGRQLIADPWWVKKAWEGRSEDIVPCIRCMNCYNPYQYRTEEQKRNNRGMKTVPCCSVNPRYLHEDRVPNVLPMAEKKKKVVLVRIETSPEDLRGMAVAQGILTMRGGMTSHAAVVARGMGKCCVSGAGEIKVDY